MGTKESAEEGLVGGCGVWNGGFFIHLIINYFVDKHTHVDELKSLVQAYCEARDWDQFHNPKELAIGAITEASELLEHFRFKSEDEMKKMLSEPKKREAIEEELADVFFFLLRFAQMNNIDLSTALRSKLTKNELKYPVEKSKGSNKKYNEL